MAKRTVGDWDGEGKREAGAAGLDEALSALSKSMAALAKELAARLMESGSSAPRVDGLVREAVLEAGCRGLEEAAEGDRSDCGAANAPRCCRGRMRCAGRERSATETALGRVRLAMGRYVCLSCGKSARPRASRLDVEGSMTPTARRMASELGSACCYGEADRLLNVVAGVNFGAKRVERTTRLVGDDLERWRTEWLSGSITVVGGDGEASNDASFDGAPVRRPLREGRILCVGLDGTGVPALPSETAGRKGKDGGRATTREAKVGPVRAAGPDALRRVPLARPADRFGARRGGLQDGRGAAHEMHRHALDGGRRQPRALGALRPPQRLVRRLLGAPPSEGGVRRWWPITKDLSHTPQDVTFVKRRIAPMRSAPCAAPRSPACRVRSRRGGLQRSVGVGCRRRWPRRVGSVRRPSCRR